MDVRTAGRLVVLEGIALFFGAGIVRAQSGLPSGNLIVNAGAEQGPASTSLTTAVTSIPGWTISSGANVVSYDLLGLVKATDPAPPDHGFKYFVAGPTNLGRVSVLTQDIDVSGAASLISGGTVKFTASAYLGSAKGVGLKPPAQMDVAFKNVSGQTFNTVTLGPLGLDANGMTLQQQIGLVPPGTTKITVSLNLTNGCENAAQCANAAADGLSLVLTTLDTSPGLVLGRNLIVNGGAEAGPGVAPAAIAPVVPGWSTAHGASVAPYGGANWITVTEPGPSDRAVNLFHGGLPGANMYQDLDVSAAASAIDANQVTFQVSAWLGGVAGTTSPTLTYQFFDWTGKQLAPTEQLTTAHTGSGLVEAARSGPLPAGTRRVHVLVAFPSVLYAADDINFTLAAPTGPPVITAAGIVTASAFGGFPAIAQGTWIEIYGMNLGQTTRSWGGDDFNNGVAPTVLDRVSVSVGGQAAYVDYVSPGQVNALVPSNAPTGPVLVTVQNAIGPSDGFPLVVNQTQPGLLAPGAFKIGGRQYVGALLSDGSFALPQGAISGVASRPAKVGETITIYGIGFGPVTGGITAGTVVTQANTLTTQVQFLFNATPGTLSYYGLAPSLTGLYQFNMVVPNVPANSTVPISVSLGGAKGAQTLYIAVQN